MKKTLIFIVTLAAAIGLVGVGYYLANQGSNRSNTDTSSSLSKEDLQKIVDTIIPPPPPTLHVLNGTIKNIVGATIQLEVIDPNDYLPHLDGSPRRMQTRYASLLPETKILLINPTQYDTQKTSYITELRLSDLKIGDAITVWSNDNLLNAEKFDVTKIELVRY